MNSSNHNFVTGASGFIGEKLVRELLRAGEQVRVLRRPNHTPHLPFPPQVEEVEGDIRDLPSLLTGMKGCGKVYHLAANAKNWASNPKSFFDVNVTGTKNVLEAAEKLGVERTLVTSTILTFGSTPKGIIGDESISRGTSKFFSLYEETKVEAELWARERAAKGQPIVIVNPTRVFGPGKLTEGNSATLMIDKYCRGKFPFLLNLGVNIGNYVFIDDLVHGLCLAMERGRIGERYILGGENVSLRDFFIVIDELTNQQHFRIPIGPASAMIYSHFLQWRAQWFGIYPQITPGWMRSFLVDWAFSSKKAESDLGYNRTPFREGMHKTIDWLANLKRGLKD